MISDPEHPDVFLDDFGTAIGRVHDPSRCEGRGCPVHHPSDHPMRSFRLSWREEGMFDVKPSHFERICSHGVGHPDPDSAAFLATLGFDVSVHGCDGCCTGSGPEAETNEKEG